MIGAQNGDSKYDQTCGSLWIFFLFLIEFFSPEKLLLDNPVAVGWEMWTGNVEPLFLSVQPQPPHTPIKVLLHNLRLNNDIPAKLLPVQRFYVNDFRK